VERFWQSHPMNLKAWYLARPHGDDVIISASGEFLLAPVCAELGVKRLIGTRMDSRTGRIQGENCWGPEKVERLRQVYPQFHMSEFYSDSRSDTPLAQVADRAFLVKGDELLPW
jgi:Phosphoserine phosphatase